jgi:glycosyltransferase involved in cell wall biosynthesis
MALGSDDRYAGYEEGPSISVIMPVHNREAVVGRAIESVLTQDFGAFELIVVDDGSTDGTPNVVEAITDRRLKCLRLPVNAGGNAARNRGIEAATAPLIAFLDSDDAFLPHKLGVIVRTFREEPEIGMLLDSFIKTYRPARDRPDVECRNPLLETNDEIVEALFTRQVWKATPGISLRREAALRAGMFDEELPRGQDFDFILRVAAVARCEITDQILWVKTNSADSISSDLRNFATATLAFYQRHPEFYSNPVYRRGFAHDLGRHFVRLLRRGKVRAAWRDAVPFARQLGLGRFLGLVIDGSLRFKSRRNRLRRMSDDQRAISRRRV